MSLVSRMFGLPAQNELNRKLLDVMQEGLDSDLDCTVSMLESALAKTNLILSRRNYRAVLTQDEEIDVGLKRARLEKIIEEIKKMYTPIPEDGEDSGLAM